MSLKLLIGFSAFVLYGVASASTFATKCPQSFYFKFNSLKTYSKEQVLKESINLGSPANSRPDMDYIISRQKQLKYFAKFVKFDLYNVSASSISTSCEYSSSNRSEKITFRESNGEETCAIGIASGFQTAENGSDSFKLTLKGKLTKSGFSAKNSLPSRFILGGVDSADGASYYGIAWGEATGVQFKFDKN